MLRNERGVCARERDSAKCCSRWPRLGIELRLDKVIAARQKSMTELDCLRMVQQV